MEGVDRDTFIKQNMKLVNVVVNKLAYRVSEHPYIDREDLQSIGTIGLIKACDRFNPSFGFKFSTFAVPTIEGEIKRYLRDHLDPIRFSRKHRQDYYTIVRANLQDEKPIIIANILDMTVEDVENALAYYRFRYVKSLDFQINDDEGNPITLADAVGIEIDMDSQVELEEFMNKLDEREKRILKLRLQDIGQVEIGKIIGVTQVQVSRILGKMKEKIGRGVIVKKENKKKDYVGAKKLAIETELNGYEISDKTGISVGTAYHYIKQYRTTSEEINEVKDRLEEKGSPVKTYKLSPEEAKKYGIELPGAEGKDVYEVLVEDEFEIIKPIYQEKVEISRGTPTKIVINEPQQPLNVNGDIALILQLEAEKAHSQLEGIIAGMVILGFKELTITIQSKQVA